MVQVGAFHVVVFDGSVLCRIGSGCGFVRAVGVGWIVCLAVFARAGFAALSSSVLGLLLVFFVRPQWWWVQFHILPTHSVGVAALGVWLFHPL